MSVRAVSLRDLIPLATAIAACIVAAAIFQVFLRYHYVVSGRTTWRIDRLTQQACRMDATPADCTPPAPLGYVVPGAGDADEAGPAP